MRNHHDRRSSADYPEYDLTTVALCPAAAVEYVAGSRGPLDVLLLDRLGDDLGDDAAAGRVARLDGLRAELRGLLDGLKSLFDPDPLATVAEGGVEAAGRVLPPGPGRAGGRLAGPLPGRRDGSRAVRPVRPGAAVPDGAMPRRPAHGSHPRVGRGILIPAAAPPPPDA